ncbi:MAG: TonB-dependent receptor [Gammaproteobacteria bacterium]|nr:TonB-dependent receptor [Gammaproteobacteria bacterium]
MFQKTATPAFYTPRFGRLPLVALALILAASGALAEDVPEPSEELEQVTVTGSRIKRTQQQDVATPLTSYDFEELRNLGVDDPRDLIQLLPSNVGAQNNADSLSQNYTVGTSNINLRGLGVSSTLVLLNGRRQVTSATPTIDGSSFVDLSALVPTLALEQVEILKDGAAAVYGSDAIAGVANFVTRSDYEGFEVSVGHRERTNNGSQSDDRVEVVYGRNFLESGNLLLALSYLDRTQLVMGEVDWRAPAWSSAGNPGNFIVLADTVLADGTELDSGATTAAPHCTQHVPPASYIPPSVFAGDPESTTHSVCRFDFGPQITVGAEEERIQAFAQLGFDLGEQTRLTAELGYTHNNIRRTISPSLPAISPRLPTIPAAHPGNPFRDSNDDPVALRYIGRIYGVDEPSETNYFNSETKRIALIAEGDVTDHLSWEMSFLHARSDIDWRVPDTLHRHLQNAMGTDENDTGLLGVGPDCPGHRDNLQDGDVCLFYNPFSVANKVLAMTWDGSAFGGTRAGTTAEQAFMRNYLLADATAATESELDVLEAVLTGDVLSFPDGNLIGYAFGVQYRDESIRGDFNQLFNDFEFSFAGGNPDYSGSRDAIAVFGEVLLPLSPDLEATIGVRHEDYGGSIGSTTDPKLSLLWTPADILSLRASASSSFRAPSLHQTQGVQATYSDVEEEGRQFFVPNLTYGNRNLKPETATSLNLGGSVALENWELNLDYWSFRFEDALARENPQEVVDTDAEHVAAGEESRVVRAAGNTIARVNTRYINTDEIRTSGLDFSIRRQFQTPSGRFLTGLHATHIFEYDITRPDGQKIDGAGYLNFANIGSPTPEWRGTLNLTWQRGNHQAVLMLNYTDDYRYRRTATVTDRIDSFTTVDLQYRLELAGLIGPDADTSLTAGILNVADEDPPSVNISGGYDPRTADPRGRRAYVLLSSRFE